jgi:hypothetical protein
MISISFVYPLPPLLHEFSDRCAYSLNSDRSSHSVCCEELRKLMESFVVTYIVDRAVRTELHYEVT